MRIFLRALFLCVLLAVVAAWLIPNLDRWRVRPAPRVQALLHLPPNRIEIASPVWDYQATREVTWATQALEPGWTEYRWSDFLEVHPDYPSVSAVSSEGTPLARLKPNGVAEPRVPGFETVQYQETRTVIRDLDLAHLDPVSINIDVPFDSPGIVFEVRTRLGYDRNPVLRISLGEVWSATVGVGMEEWRTLSLRAETVPAGTHELSFQILSQPSLRDPRVGLQEFGFRAPLSVRAVLPSASAPPLLQYRPKDSVTDLLTRKIPAPTKPRSRVSAPWNVYDEDNRWVRTVEVNGVARTGLMLPTPSEFCVEATPESRSKLKFYPAIYDFTQPGKAGGARLSVGWEKRGEFHPLWEGTVGIESKFYEQRFASHIRPLAWQSYRPDKMPYQPAWDEGIEVSLAKVPSGPIKLVFRTSPSTPDDTVQSVVLGDPVILPPAVNEALSPWVGPQDVLDWDGLFEDLVTADRTRKPGPARRLWLLLDWQARVAVANHTVSDPIPEATKSIVIRGFNDLLERPDFYDERSFPIESLPEACKELLSRKEEGLSPRESVELNRFLLEVALPENLRQHLRPVAPPAERPNIILISLDTLRGDSLSCMGYERETSPWIDRYFGQAGVMFSRVEAPSTWTLPSHAGLFLSQYFSRHGIHQGNQAVPEKAFLPGEIFSRQGYETAAFVDRGYLHHRYGFNQGFQYYDERGGGFASILPRCSKWLAKRDPSTPLLLFLHTYDIHGPYSAKEPYRSRFLREGLEPSQPGYRVPDFNLFQAVNKGLVTIPETDIEYCRSLYDGGILYVDEALEEFFESIGERGLLENALVILFSDHGEGFGEHSLFDHGWSVYEELTHVPVLIRFPDGSFAGTRVDTPVSLIDVFPTLFDYLGWEAPPEWQGTSLLPHIRDPSLPADRRLYSEIESHKAMYQGLVKLLTRPNPMRRPDGVVSEKLEAFDIANDPLETENLVHRDHVVDFTGEADLMGKALGVMESENRARGGAEEAPVDEESVAELKAMGYLQ